MFESTEDCASEAFRVRILLTATNIWQLVLRHIKGVLGYSALAYTFQPFPPTANAVLRKMWTSILTILLLFSCTILGMSRS